jgi:hypothetical protein
MFNFKGIDAGFEASLTHVEIEFNSCQGWNGQNNDLWVYMRLYYADKKVSSTTLATLSRTLVETITAPMLSMRTWPARDTLRVTMFCPKNGLK